MKNTKKLISVLLVAMLLISTLVATGTTTASAATGTLTSYYSTNPGGKVGVQKTISVDGSLSDWDSSMLIAQGTANDDPRVYRENSMHELPVDLYALYAAYDDSNLYLMWEMTNVGDVVCPEQGYVTSQGILWQTQEFPFFIAIDTGKTSDAIGNQGQLQTGGTLWDSGITFSNSFNRIISINTKAHNGPFVYGGNSSGLNAVEIYDRSTSGIKMKYGLGILSDKVYGIDKGYGSNNGRVVGDMCSESSAWVDFNTKGHSSSTMDFFYEMSIPYSELGITKNDVTSNGIGAMVISTFGLSGMDCLPYDLCMNDNADQPDTKSQEINTFEKSDQDNVTVPFARIGAQGDTPIPTTPTTPTQPTDPTEPEGDTLTVNAKSNYFNTSSVSDLEVGDTVTVKYDLNSNFGVASAQWNLSYDSSKLRLKTDSSSICPVGGGTVNTSGNPVYGNFTDENLVDFNGGGTFVQAEFEVLAKGSTDVNLTVEELNVAFYDTSGNFNCASPVENGQVVNIKGKTGFSNASLTPTSTTVKGSDIADTIKVTADSNFFDSASATFDKDTKQVTVTYQFKSNFKMVNTQWSLRYDKSKLSLDAAYMPKVAGANITKYDDLGAVTGNFTNLSSMIDFSSLSDFAVFVFDVKGTGETTVNLNVSVLGLGYLKDGEVQDGYLVDNGTVKNLKGETGFTNLSYSKKTIVAASGSFLRGDVNQDGKVSVEDATTLQRYLAEYITLSPEQMLAADANNDGKVNIRDVSAIQRAVAKYITLPA